jgi:hypothetical protein
MRYQLIGILVAVTMLFIIAPAAAQETPVGTPLPEALAEDLVELTEQTAAVTVATLDDFLNRLVQAPQSDIARLLMVVGGVILLVAGWRIYEVIIVIAGFLIGASVATSLVITDSTLMNLVILIIGGLIGAALSVFVYYVAVFLIGAYIGIALTGGLAAAMGFTPVSALILLIGGVLGGALLVGLSFEFLVLVSALVGAQMLTLALGLDAIWTILLAVIGVVVQLVLMRAYKYPVRRRPRQFNILRRVTG